MNYFTAVIQSILSYFFLSLGFVLQKKGIDKTDRILWIIGFLMVNLAPVLNFMALNTLSSQVVTAVSGLNIIFTIFLSKFLIRNKVFSSDYFYSLLIMVFIAGAGFYSHPGSRNFNLLFSRFFLFLLFSLFILYFLFRISFQNKQWNVPYSILLSLISGSSGGFMIILMKLIQVQYGFHLISYLYSPFLYFYLICGIISFLSINLAYKIGDIILISPVQYGSMVFYPALASYFIFSVPVIPLQGVFFCGIILSIVMLVYSHERNKKKGIIDLFRDLKACKEKTGKGK